MAITAHGSSILLFSPMPSKAFGMRVTRTMFTTMVTRGFDVVLGELEKAMKRAPRKYHRTVLVHFGFAQA